jgi:hypothetical protein
MYCCATKLIKAYSIFDHYHDFIPKSADNPSVIYGYNFTSL